MRITIESTEQIVTVNGNVPARVWVGETDSGIKVQVMVTRIAVDRDEDRTQFAAELQEHRAPLPVGDRAWPNRMVL